MTSPAITITSDASLADAAALILSRRIGCLPVLDEAGRLMGLITDDSFFPREKQVPYTHERFAWLLGGWLGDIDQLEETLRGLRDHPVTDGLMVLAAGGARHASSGDREAASGGECSSRRDRQG